MGSPTPFQRFLLIHLKTANKVVPAVVIALTPRDSSEAPAHETLADVADQCFLVLRFSVGGCLNLCVGHLRSGLVEQDAIFVSEMLSLSTNFQN